MVTVLDKGFIKLESFMGGDRAVVRSARVSYAGEDNDPKSGLNHMAHVACNALFLVSYSKREGMNQWDDREHLDRRDVRAIQKC